MQSSAQTVAAYLEELTPERRAMVAAVRAVVLANLDGGYCEAMQYGMIAYAIPHSVFPPGYHVNPALALPFAAIGSQKNYLSVYLMGLYTGSSATGESDEVRWFRDAWAASGKKKLDMGKSCVRVKKLDDIALDVIGESIRRLPAHEYIARYLQAMQKS
jgi:hypothetical protein